MSVKASAEQRMLLFVAHWDLAGLKEQIETKKCRGLLPLPISCQWKAFGV